MLPSPIGSYFLLCSIATLWVKFRSGSLDSDEQFKNTSRIQYKLNELDILARWKRIFSLFDGKSCYLLGIHWMVKFSISFLAEIKME